MKTKQQVLLEAADRVEALRHWPSESTSLPIDETQVTCAWLALGWVSNDAGSGSWLGGEKLGDFVGAEDLLLDHLGVPSVMAWNDETPKAEVVRVMREAAA